MEKHVPVPPKQRMALVRPERCSNELATMGTLARV